MTIKNLIASTAIFIIGFTIPFCLLGFFTWQRLARSRFPSRDWQRDWEVFWYQAPQTGLILGTIFFFAVLRIWPVPEMGRATLIRRTIFLSIPLLILRQMCISRGKIGSGMSLESEIAIKVVAIAIAFFVLEAIQVGKSNQIKAGKENQDEND